MAESAQDEEQHELDSLARSRAREPGGVIALIEKLYENRERIRTLVIGTIDENGKSVVDFGAPYNPPMLSHLARSIDVKLSRYYTRAMFPDQPPAGPSAGVKGNAPQAQIPRHVRRQLVRAQKRVKRARRGPPPETPKP